MNSTNQPSGFHIRLRLRDDRVIAPTIEHRRVLARIVFSQAREERLLAFGAPDTHGHLEAAVDRQTAGQLAHRIEVAAHYELGLGVSFAPAYFEPIRNQNHLKNAFIYILKQNQRHGVQSDPFCEASNLPDLLGLRLLGQFTATHVRSLLPRIRRSDLVDCFGIVDLQLEKLPIELVSPAMVMEAAAAALGLPSLTGGENASIEARATIVHYLSGVISQRELASLLGISTRTVRRLARRQIDPRLLRATELQVALRHQTSLLYQESPPCHRTSLRHQVGNLTPSPFHVI